MSIDTFVTNSTGNRFDPAAQAAQRRAESETAREAEIATIKEKGFTAYVKEMEEEKIKKMREEILRAMGLTEEALAAMQPEARATVEEAISQTIQKRLAATSAVNGEGKGGAQAPTQQTMTMLAQHGGSDLGKGGATPTINGNSSSLLSLQEVEPDHTGAVTDAKSSRERGRGLPT